MGSRLYIRTGQTVGGSDQAGYTLYSHSWQPGEARANEIKYDMHADL